MKLRNFHLVVIVAMALAATFAAATISRADSVTDKLLGKPSAKAATVRSGDVEATIKPSVGQAAPGQDIGGRGGWHAVFPFNVPVHSTTVH